MSSAQKIIQAAAGNAGAGETYVEDVFSTYLYEGTGDNQTNTVVNGLDLDGEGGMVWTKGRDIAYSPIIFDSERGLETFLYTSADSAEANQNARSNMSFNSDGYSFGSTSATSWGPINEGNYNFVSWAFRKAPKFFDVVTYTGNGVAGRTVSHNLGAVPGCVMVKRLNLGANWYVWHNSFTGLQWIELNSTAAVQSSNSTWASTTPTSSEFTLGTDAGVNGNGDTYVAYLFAHNNGDGEFGENADQDIIKCGSYTADGSGNASVNLGFEPQWLMIKSSSAAENWVMIDNMRGLVVGGTDPTLYANLSNSEYTAGGGDRVDINATGFDTVTNRFNISTANESYIYIAIRRGPMKTPEDATEVFEPIAYTGTGGSQKLTTSFSSDLVIHKARASGSTGFPVLDRLRSPQNSQQRLLTNTTDAENGSPDYWIKEFGNDYLQWNSLADEQTGNNSGTSYILWNFRRAPGFFDVVAYTGDGANDRTVRHNLGVVPELMIIKCRSSTANWWVWHTDYEELTLNEAYPGYATSLYIGTPTDTNIVFESPSIRLNGSSEDYIAYLFASLPGVSKVGSYTADASGNVASIDLGFVPRFVLIKSTTDTTSWLVYDTARGIPDGDDPVLVLNTTGAEPFNPGDRIDLTATGFELEPNSGSVSEANETYIYLAIA